MPRRSVLRLALCVLGACAYGAAAGCFLQSVSPALGPTSGSTNAAITLQGEWLEGAVLLIDGVAFAGTLNTSTAGVVRFTTPAGLAPESVTLSSDLCGGELLFETYDFSVATVTPSTTTIRGSGGSSITMNIAGITLRDWSQVALELTAGCNSESVVYAGSVVNPGSIFFRTDNAVNSVLCAPGTATARLALNGQNFEALAGLTFNIDDKGRYKVLFVYISPIEDFGWTYAQNRGRLAVAEQFGVSVDTPYIENIPEHDPVILRQVIEQYYPMDMVMLTSEGYITAMDVVAPDYPDVMFVLNSEVALDYNPNAANVDVVWGTLYEARYLAGVVAGGMLPASGDQQICYIKAYDNPEVTRGMDAFFLGARKSNPFAKLRSVTINSWHYPFMEVQAAKKFLGVCDILAQHSDTSEPQQVFSDHGKYCIGSNSDTRVFLGENVLASPLFHWEVPYIQSVQDGLDGVAGNRSIVSRFYQGTVSLSALSGLVPSEVRSTVEREMDQLMQHAGKEYIYCGPIFDSENHLAVPAGECATQKELAKIDWEVKGITNTGYLTPNYPENNAHYLSDGLRGTVYAVLGLTFLFAAYCIVWVIKNKKTKVIRYAQPFFLYFVLVGSLIGLSTIIPLSMDHSLVDVDMHDPDLESKRFPSLDIACESQLWLLFTGFSLAVPALFVKTWRIARIFEAGKGLKRIKISLQDCTIAIGCGLAFVWTVLGVRFAKGPRYYKIFITDFDDYGNPTSSYGTCVDRAGIYWVLPIWVFVILSLAYGNYLGFKCRRNETINSESKWITLCLMNILQTCIIALPIIVYEDDNPALGFGVKSFAVLVAFGGTVAMLFVPKLMMSPEEMAALDNLKTGTSTQSGVRAQNSSSSYKETSVIAEIPTTTEMAPRFSHHNPMV